MKPDAKQISEKLTALLKKLQAGYQDLETQLNTALAARDARIAELEERIKALEAQA